jgi:hypothetical protein
LFGEGGKKKKRQSKESKLFEAEEKEAESYVPKHVRDQEFIIRDESMETGIINRMIDPEHEYKEEPNDSVYEEHRTQPHYHPAEYATPAKRGNLFEKKESSCSSGTKAGTEAFHHTKHTDEDRCPATVSCCKIRACQAPAMQDFVHLPFVQRFASCRNATVCIRSVCTAVPDMFPRGNHADQAPQPDKQTGDQGRVVHPLSEP